MQDYKVIAGESDISVVEEYFGKERNTFPWEWFFISCLQNVELDMSPEMAYRFVIFVKEFYPNFKWINFDASSWKNTVQTEAKFSGMAFSNMTEHHSPNSIALPHAKEFGMIVREFLVRYRSYTFIRENDKTIFTTVNNAYEAFRGYISEGYHVELLDKVNWVSLDSNDSLLKGVFRPFPKNLVNRDVCANNCEETIDPQASVMELEDLVIPGCGARSA